MRAALAGVAGVLAFLSVAAGGAEVDDSAPPIVEQLLDQAASLGLTPEQIQAIEVIRDRRAHALAALAERLRATEVQTTAAAEHDTVALMQEMGRLQVLSGRDALQQLTPAQRQRWVTLQEHGTVPTGDNPSQR